MCLPSFDDPQCSRAHAVDAPVRVSVVVADGDGEAAVVGPDDVQVAILGAVDLQSRALARVRGEVARLPLRPTRAVIAAGVLGGLLGREMRRRVAHVVESGRSRFWKGNRQKISFIQPLILNAYARSFRFLEKKIKSKHLIEMQRGHEFHQIDSQQGREE